jgi:peroxiredoxin family protein
MAVEGTQAPVPTHQHEEHAHKKMVIIASSNGLEAAWEQLIIATTGAAMGMDTTVFFTFWGLLLLVKKEKRITGENWMQKMVAMMDHPGVTKLKMSKMNFAGAGPKMMRKIAKDQSVASPGDLLQMAVDLGVKLLPCQMTMEMFGLKREDMIDGIGEPVGAAAMLMEAQDAVTFFI